MDALSVHLIHHTEYIHFKNKMISYGIQYIPLVYLFSQSPDNCL